MDWRELNKRLPLMTEGEVLALLTSELNGPRRVSHLERLHQRYTMLRAARERMELVREAKGL